MTDGVDLIVLGGGTGIFAASRGAKLGLNVVLVENRKIGGVCLNWGGLATKTLTSTVELFKNVKKANQRGINGSVSLDWVEMKKNKDNVCSQFSRFPEIFLKKDGVRIIIGQGEILSSTKVKITSDNGEEIIKTKNILIATGSHPITIPGVELRDPILDSDQMLELESPPKDLIIVGGGIVGLEFATIFSHLNSNVTLVEMLPTLLPNEEPEVNKFLLSNLRKDGIEVLVNSKVTEINLVDNGVNVKIKTPSGEISKNADKVMMAIGRKPNINREKLEAIGVETTSRGILVDDRMQTSVENIWAMGDAVFPHLIANVAIKEGKVAASNIAGKDSKMDYELIPRCCFTIPEVAAIGLTEKQAKDQGLEIETVKVNFSAQNFRAVASNKIEGFIKIVTLNDGTIIGATIVGACASDLISEFTLAIKNEMSAKEMSELIFVHPSFSEAIQNALEKIQGLSMI
ncbi:MAG: dihydrolipoyl dehydrogenase [Candidatus Bathyarchaeum sp.]|nr:MAG: dihydrolipoyl dehydrogenase [Candidatus Bathyarchaeum sp.]